MKNSKLFLSALLLGLTAGSAWSQAVNSHPQPAVNQVAKPAQEVVQTEQKQLPVSELKRNSEGGCSAKYSPETIRRQERHAFDGTPLPRRMEGAKKNAAAATVKRK